MTEGFEFLGFHVTMRWDKRYEYFPRIEIPKAKAAHTPFVRHEGKTVIVNPGSLGQPKTGRPLACYALWENVMLTSRNLTDMSETYG